MGMFGPKRTRMPGDFAPDPDATGFPGMPAMAAPPSRFSSIAGGIGDILTGNPVFANRQQQEMENDFKRQEIEAAAERRGAPQAVPLGGGGFGTWSPTGGLQILREPAEREVAVPALQQNFDWLKKLPPEDQKLAATMLPGYAFTPSGVATAEQRAEAVAEAAARARAKYRAPAAAPHSKPMSLPGGFILDN